jgi:hypothetical protein
MEGIMIPWEEAVVLDLQVLQAKDTSLPAEGKHISVGSSMQAINRFYFTGFTMDLEGLQL